MFPPPRILFLLLFLVNNFKTRGGKGRGWNGEIILKGILQSEYQKREGKNFKCALNIVRFKDI